MKKLLILPLLLAFQIVSAQWNAIGWNPFTLRSTSGDSTFVLSAPSRVDLQKGTASWVPASGASYKVYTALLTQSGTDAPVATVLENTLGGTLVWTRYSAGIYKATLSSVFTENKTVVYPDYAVGYYINNLSTTIRGSRVSSNDISIEYSGGVDFSDEGISNVLIEIRVYP